MWSWSGRNHEQVKIVFAIIAAAYVIFEYRAGVSSDQVERSLTYAEIHATGEIAESSMRLYGFWFSEEADSFFEDVNSNNYDQKLVELIYANDLTRDVYDIQRFYNQLALCANGDLCDSETSCDYFFDTVQAFRETYRPYLRRISTRYNEDILESITKFVEVSCRAEFKAYCEELTDSPDCDSE